MNAIRKRLYVWVFVAVLVAIGLLSAFWPRASIVDLQEIEAGRMILTVGDEGETRVVDVFLVSAPVDGRLRRIEAEAGDLVVAGQTVVAQVEPTESQLLDPRTEAEARAQLSAAESAALLAEAELQRAEAELRFAESELERSRELAGKGTISERDLEAAEREFETGRAAIGVAQANMQVRQYELARVQAQLMSPEQMAQQRETCECLSINSPVNGRVLRVIRESEGFVRAGDGLVEIGNPEKLEIVVDLLSIDAVKVSPGDSAIIENWGGEQSLAAQVRRVEPLGFTKVSALGIEEQRVNVILDITSPAAEWGTLGHGYHVDVRVVLWEGESVLKAPLTALFRHGDEWAVFVEEKGKARQRIIEVGNTTSSSAEILSGLKAGERIVVYPGEGIGEGVRIAARAVGS